MGIAADGEINDAMPYDGIIFALESRFDGVGAPEHTELFVERQTSRPEYCTRDKRGFMFMRAFVYEDEMPYERMWKQALRRLVFLKHKLIADLEAGDKIFVYRLTDCNLEPGELERLHEAVRSYGDNTLLYVRYEDAAHPNGMVEFAAPGLMIGYIDRFKMAPDGQLSASPPSASWLEICRNACALFTGASKIPEAAPSIGSAGVKDMPAADRHIRSGGDFFRPKLRDGDYSEKRDDQIRELLRQRAFERLYRPHPAGTIVESHPELYDVAAEIIGREAPITVLEFGVARGRSMQMFTERFSDPDARFVGFDSFVGLPEAWLMHEAGAFSNRGVPPAVVDSRVSFVKGWFQNSLPGYLDSFSFDPARTYLVHFDADLYASTLFLLSSLWARVPDYYFIMDDFTQDDMSALFDFASAYPIEIAFIAQTRGGGTPPMPGQVLGRMRRAEFQPSEAGAANSTPLSRPQNARGSRPETGGAHNEPVSSQISGPVEKLSLNLDTDGTRVRRGLAALEEIYNPRPAPLIAGNKDEFCGIVARTIGDMPLTYLEFGVWRGGSIARMARYFRHPGARFYGFDSFEGLPERWDPNNDVGQFSTDGALPDIADNRVSFVKGWFQDTVPGFLASHAISGPVLVHYDADLYSSTLFLLTTLSQHFPEYYFIFDEFFPDEVNALREFVLAYPIELGFDAAILNQQHQRPVQLFGRMRRVPFTLPD